ncbi:MAG: hypothetical protein RLZ71_891 [Actinomycetota bacterium]|jgi:hypothetical protein
MSALLNTTPRQVLAAAQQRNPVPYKIAKVIVLGLAAIQLAQLLIGVFTTQGAYDMANLKAERRELTTTSDILRGQVDSLASNQNLSNAALSLGMIPNSSPVFIRLSDQQVFGKPKAAQVTASSHISRNLVPNAALTAHTNVADLQAVSDVAPTSSTTVALPLISGELPVSPTH